MRPESKKKHFEKLPAWPEADVIDQTVDGLVPAARIDTWEHFNHVVGAFRSDDGGEEFMFRGQHHYKWFLEPTLDRMAAGAISTELAARQLRYFRLSIRGRVADNSLLKASEDLDDPQAMELWAVGQHHGLATPLLDWTRSPYVALFFAFVDEDHPDWTENGNRENSSRAVYILNKSFLEDLENPVDNKYPRVVEPSKDDHGRLVNQAGLFSIAPYGETLESSLLRALVDSKVDVDDPAVASKYLCKLHIPNSRKIRRECLRHLRKMNIHHASLFPDVIGAASYCNELAREYVVKQRVSRSGEGVRRKTDIPYWEAHTLPDDAEGLKPLIDSLLVNDQVKKSAKLNELTNIARSVVEFINTKAGVDWYSRESELARLRTFVRRRLGRINFEEDSIAEAAVSIASKVATLSKTAVEPRREGSTETNS